MKPRVLSILLTVFILLCRATVLPAQTAPAIPLFEQKTAPVQINEVYIDTAVQKLQRRQHQAPDSTIKGLLALYPACELLHYPKGKISVLMSIGAILMIEKENLPQALVYMKRAYPYFSQLKVERDRYLVLWNSNMGAVYTHMGLTDSAMRYYYNGLTIALKSNTQQLEVAQLFYNIGILHFNIKQYDKAMYYTQKAMAINLKAKEKQALAMNYFSMATLLVNQSDFKSAKEYLQRIVDLKLPKDKYDYQLLHQQYAYLYLKQDQPEKALPYCKLLLTESDQHSRYYVSALNDLAWIYGTKKEYAKCEIYFKKALSNYMQSNPEGRDISLRVDIYRNLAEVNDLLHNYKEAYEYKTILANLQDSLNNVQNVRSVSQMETRYRIAEKDKALTQKELQLIKVQNTLNTKNIWIGGISAGLVIVILFAIQILQRTKAREQQQKVDRLKVLIEGEENERVRIGQQLHDDVMVEFSIVRMNMETLPTQFPEVGEIKEYRDIVQQLNNASIKLRQTAHNLMPDALLEEGLISALIYFCRGVQQMTGLAIDFQHYSDIPRLPIDTEIAVYRIVQELIQNIIKHAAATEVLVQLDYREQALNLTVEDNGIGMNNITDSLKNGRGLNSIRTRLKAINGAMEICACTPHGTSVNVEINL